MNVMDPKPTEPGENLPEQILLVEDDVGLQKQMAWALTPSLENSSAMLGLMSLASSKSALLAATSPFISLATTFCAWSDGMAKPTPTLPPLGE